MTQSHSGDMGPDFRLIARRYAQVNRWLSLGLDQRWRRHAALAASPAPGELVLDICTGTGDLALALWRSCPQCRITGIDASREMLSIAAHQSPDSGPCYQLGDALALPYAPESYDLATMAFGLRNLRSRTEGLREARRVLRPGGRLVILEFAAPGRGPVGLLAGWWVRNAVPRLGALLGGHHGPYRYLSQSIVGFPHPESIAAEIEGVGFTGVTWQRLWPGVVVLYAGRK